MIFSPFAYRHKIEGVGPTPTPTATPTPTPTPTGPTPTPTETPTPTPTPTPATNVTWKFRYIANNVTTRTKTASNLYFTFQDVTYSRSNVSYIGSVNNTVTITTDTNTGAGIDGFNIYRDLCRGTGGAGTPRIDQYVVKIYRNGSEIFSDLTDLANPTVPICSTQDSRVQTTGTIAVNGGDEIIVEWNDTLTT